MDAGCSKHGCWYIQQGFKDCYASGDGQCILAFAVSASPPPDEGIDLSGCAVIASGTVTADRLESGPVTTGEFTGAWDAGEVEFSPAPLYSLHPGSVVSGRQFDLAFLPRPGRGVVYREHEHSPAEAPHPAQEHPDPEEGDVWYVPWQEGRVGLEGRNWLFYQGAWREVLDLRLEVLWDRAPEIDGLVLGPHAERVHRPRLDSVVQMRGTWR